MSDGSFCEETLNCQKQVCGWANDFDLFRQDLQTNVMPMFEVDKAQFQSWVEGKEQGSWCQ